MNKDRMNFKVKVRVNDQFRIEADRYQYILIESYLGKPGKDKDGNKTEPRLQERESYYPSLEACIAAVRDLEVKQSDTIAQIIDALGRSYALNRESAETVKP